MSITEIRPLGAVDGVKAPVSHSIHAIPGNTTLDELTEFAWKDLSTPDKAIGAYRLVSLADDPDVWEQRAMIRTCGWFSARRREWAHLPGNDLKFHQL